MEFLSLAAQEVVIQWWKFYKNMILVNGKHIRLNNFV